MTTYSLDSDAIVAVVGAGSMGAGIAQLAAQSGHEVKLFDVQPGAAATARERIAIDLEGAVKRGRFDGVERDAVIARIEAVEVIEELAGASVAVEAIIEKVEPKKALFAQLEALLGVNAVLATNTSSISVSALAEGLQHPERVVGWHFFNPVTRMKLVEVISGVATDPALIDAMHGLGKRWGKTSVDAPNAPGFIVNRVARPYYAEALRLLAERVAAPAAIDRLLREAGGFAMGPFELIDLIGVDVNLSVTESVFAATAWDSRYAPHIIQQELVRAGRFGRKRGVGFYRYGDGVAAPKADVVAMSGLPIGQVIGTAVDLGALAPLVERLQGAGIPTFVDSTLEPGTLRFNDDVVAFTDGRTLAERRYEGEPVSVLLDLARDFATVPVMGATGSASALGALASLLFAAGIELIALDDVAGLVVTRTVACIVNEAADLMTWTNTRAADIDTSMRLGMSYTVGPLAWADALGASRVVEVLANLQRHYGDARYRRSPKLTRAAHGRFLFHS